MVAGTDGGRHAVQSGADRRPDGEPCGADDDAGFEVVRPRPGLRLGGGFVQRSLPGILQQAHGFRQQTVGQAEAVVRRKRFF